MSKSVLKTLRALMVATTALWGTQTAFGGPIQPHFFDITENSSTSLTVTYDGSPLTVTPSGPDSWSFLLPTGFLANSFGTNYQWIEPGNPALVNSVGFGSNITRAGFVQSDLPLSTQPPPVADGAPVLVGTDGGVSAFAKFHDLGDSAAVPDSGASLSLFGVSLLGLGFLRRRLC